MNKKIEKLLNNQQENYIFPFFWLHGESEEVLRRYVKVIDEANMKAFCVESRPHPDYCGDRWWKDMDAILDEAEKRNMKVWILDDSHFPTGYANGALEEGNNEWTGECMPFEKVGRKLYDKQIDFHVIPSDVFTEIKKYATDLTKGLQINKQKYKMFVIPYMQYITEEVADTIITLQQGNSPVIFIDGYPKGLCNGKKLPKEVKKCPVIDGKGLASYAINNGIHEVTLRPSNSAGRKGIFRICSL